MIQASFADCAAVGTSHRDNPTEIVHWPARASTSHRVLTHCKGEHLIQKRKSTHFDLLQHNHDWWEESHIGLCEFRQHEKTRRRTSCNMRKGKKGENSAE